MPTQIHIGGLSLDVFKKHIKNVHLSVYPPTGRVRISAPIDMDISKIRVFAISKLGWVKQQQKKLQSQDRESPREYLDRESHYVFGRRYLLKVVERDAAPKVELKHRHIVLHIRPGSTMEKRKDIMDDWYRSLLRESIPILIEKWERLINVKISGFFVQAMKTKWGSANPAMRTIRFNTELAKKPPECLEYLVVHELVHFLEPTHNERFRSLMSRFLPRWQLYKKELNRLPVKHDTWVY